MSLSFTKMHGLGNDFVVIDNLAGNEDLNTARIRKMGDRHFGIGFDQMLVVEKPGSEDVEFNYRIFNTDGEEVEHCGNGARCFARYVRDKGLTESRNIKVSTSAGNLSLLVRDDNQVTVSMGIPTFEPARIPFDAAQRQLSYELEVERQKVELSACAIGNPHAVILVDDVDTAPVSRLGPLIENHPRFPKRVNVGFLQIVDRSHARLRVYERGVGETRACGTGACAAVVVAVQKNLLDKTAIVTLPGGELDILWEGENHNVEMTGPCTTVFEGHTEM